jgi:hypothetical protein
VPALLNAIPFSTIYQSWNKYTMSRNAFCEILTSSNPPIGKLEDVVPPNYLFHGFIRFLYTL